MEEQLQHKREGILYTVHNIQSNDKYMYAIFRTIQAN